MQTVIRSIFLLAVILAGTALSGCWSPGGPVADVPEKKAPQPVFPAEFYADIPEDEGRVFRVDNEVSTAHLFLWRAGLLAKKGHNHILRVRKMKGAFFLPDDMLSQEARLDIVFEVEDIEVDPMVLRQEIGGGFTGTGMTPEGARATRENMLGEKVLDADRFPAVGLRTTRIIGELPKLVFDTVITLHGLERQIFIPVTAQLHEDRLEAAGAFVIEQTNFAIEPFSAMGGALFIEDPIMIEIDLVFRAR